MNQVLKSQLSEPQLRLIQIFQQVNFGRIERLQVRDGQILFEISPRVIQKLKIGGENGPRPELTLDDFVLKAPLVELFRTIESIQGDAALAIELRCGLPTLVDVERLPAGVGAQDA